MIIQKSVASDNENIDFIYSGLDNISEQGRKHLKNVAQSLIALQDNPGTPIPDHIRRDIMQNPSGELM